MISKKILGGEDDKCSGTAILFEIEFYVNTGLIACCDLGPFTIAFDLIAKREAALKQRAESIANGNFISTSRLTEDSETNDEYDKMVIALHWNSVPIRSAEFIRTNVWPSLAERCVQFIADNFETFESQIDAISFESRAQLAHLLSKRKVISSDMAIKLAARGSQGLCLPDCSQVHEDSLIRALEMVSESIVDEEEGDQGDSGNEGGLRIIQLQNAGFGFGEKAVAAVMDKVSGLEILTISGCYRLSDATLAELIRAASSSLTYLDLSSNSRVGPATFSAIASASNLSSLILNHCMYLTEDAFASLSSTFSSISTATSSVYATSISSTEALAAGGSEGEVVSGGGGAKKTRSSWKSTNAVKDEITVASG